MKKIRYCLLLVLCTPLILLSQEDTLSAKASNWTTGASLGLDFSQLLQINPRQGAGQNRIGAGTAISAFAKYKKKSGCLGTTSFPGSLVFNAWAPGL
jgi:hypothetical protein